MSSNRFSHTGMGSSTYNDIPSNAIFDISGMGSVTINGTIGEGARINISGMGSVNINGTVSENVRFDISGMGSTNFKKRPPQSVLDTIRHSGMGTVNMPGGFTKKSGQSNGGSVISIGNGSINIGGMSVFSSGRGSSVSLINGRTIVNGQDLGYIGGNSVSVIGGRTYVDGVEIDTDRQERKERNSHVAIYNRIGQEPVARREPVVRQEPVVVEEKLSPEDTFLKDCSKYTKQYVESFKGKKSHTTLVEEMKLTQAELDQLEAAGCIDSITFEIMNRPVEVNEQVYDLNTVLTFNGKDPKRVEFEARDVAASRKTVTAFEDTIKKIMEARKLEAAKKNSKENENAGAPGGPSFMDAETHVPGGPSF